MSLLSHRYVGLKQQFNRLLLPFNTAIQGIQFWVNSPVGRGTATYATLCVTFHVSCSYWLMTMVEFCPAASAKWGVDEFNVVIDHKSYTHTRKDSEMYNYYPKDALDLIHKFALEWGHVIVSWDGVKSVDNQNFAILIMLWVVNDIDIIIICFNGHLICVCYRGPHRDFTHTAGHCYKFIGRLSRWQTEIARVKIV